MDIFCTVNSPMSLTSMKKAIVLILGMFFLQTAQAQPSWAELLVTSVRTGDTEVFSIDPLTGNAFNLSQSPKSEDRYPACSPDGKKVVFTSNRATGQTYDLYLVNQNGQKLKQLTSLPTGSVAYWASWTTDGNYIYFNEGGTGAVYRIRPDGIGFQKVADGRDGNISPDGKKIVYTQKGSKGFGVWVMNADGSNPQQIIPDESEIGGIAPVWPPGGRRIAFSGQAGEPAEIFICNADDSGLAQVTDLQKISSSPALSPDGQYLAFRVSDVAYWRDEQTRNKAHTEKLADKRPVYWVKLDGSGVGEIEVLHYQGAIDDSRAEWQPYQK